MKTYGIWSLTFVLACGVAQAADEPTPKQVAKAKVEEINKAVIKEDYAKVVDLTHPKIVELIGGREKMIAVLEAGTKQMKEQGVSIRSVKVDDASDPVAAGDDLYLIVPFTMEMKVPDGKLTQKSFVLGISSDKGKSWTFVNGEVDAKKMKELLPNIPAEVKFPERQKPVLEKDSK